MRDPHSKKRQSRSSACTSEICSYLINAKSRARSTKIRRKLPHASQLRPKHWTKKAYLNDYAR
jgi:hypothetical protein